MFKRTFRILLQMLGGLGAGFAIISLLIAWQLHRGPVSLAFLTPYVESAMNQGHRGFRLAISDTTLTWAGWERAVDIRVTDVRAIEDGGQVVARIPELSLSLSGAALLRGMLAPRYIEFLGPEIRVRRMEDGSLNVKVAGGNDQSEEGMASGLVSWLVKKPDPGSPMSYLNTVSVSGATMTFEDRTIEKTWTAPVGHFTLQRAPHGLLAKGLVRIDVDGRSADIALHGSYRVDDERLDMTASFNEISPASFSELYYRLGPLAALDLPLSGTVVVGAKRDGTVESIGFNVKGGVGDILLPLPFHQSISIQSLALRGIVNGVTGVATVDDMTVDLARGSMLNVPDPLRHSVPLEKIVGAGKFQSSTGRLDIANLHLELAGPTLDAKGMADGIGGDKGVALRLSGQLNDVPVNSVDKYWPQALGSDPHAWVTNRIRGGVVKQATAELDVQVSPAGEIDIRKVNGTMLVDGATVEYLAGMPAVTDAAATISYDEKAFDIAVTSGRTGAVKILGGTIRLSGLQDVDQFADIDLRIDSPFADALAYIDSRPLGFAKAMGLSGAKAKGQADLAMKLHFMLAKDLKMSEVKAKATAKLKKVAIDNVVLGHGIKDGDLTLEVDTNGMVAAGDVMMGQIPVDLSWRQNFGDKPAFKSLYTMKAAIDDIKNVRDLGVDIQPLVGRNVTGGADATVRYTIFDRRSSRIEIDTDLARAELAAPLFNWRKPAGMPARASTTILIENKAIKSIPKFEATAGDLDIRGDIAYSPAGTGLERVNFQRLNFGRTRVSGALISHPNGSWEAGLQGKELDFSPLWDRFIHEKPGRSEEIKIPDVTIALEVDKMWIDRDRFLGAVSGTFAHRADIWRTVILDSKMNGQQKLNIDLRPDKAGNRTLLVKADDGGAALQFLDYYDKMRGGKLEIRGQYDDAAPGRPLKGKLRVDNYRIQNAPILARVLSVMALTGIVDALTGDGLNFSELDVPFTFSEGVLEIKDARASGASLGFTAGGTVYTYADVVDLKGTVVPAYALNSIFGKIPLLGEILTGTEKGGGIFAANFQLTGPLEDPKATVNPLSALTPGILRNVFGILDAPDPKPDQKRENRLLGNTPTQ